MIERQNDALAKETMEWDDIIHEEQAKRTELPEGDYSFTVKRLEKGRFEGSDKLPACNIATLILEDGGRKRRDPHETLSDKEARIPYLLLLQIHRSEGVRRVFSDGLGLGRGLGGKGSHKAKKVY